MNITFKSIVSIFLLLTACTKQQSLNSSNLSETPTEIQLKKGQSIPSMSSNEWVLKGRGFAITSTLRQKISGCEVSIKYDPMSMKLNFNLEIEDNIRFTRTIDLSANSVILKSEGRFLIAHNFQTRPGTNNLRLQIAITGKKKNSQLEPYTIGAQLFEIGENQKNSANFDSECNTDSQLKTSGPIGGSLQNVSHAELNSEPPKSVFVNKVDSIRKINFKKDNDNINIVIETRYLKNAFLHVLKKESYTIPANLDFRPIFTYRLDWTEETPKHSSKMLTFEFPYSKGKFSPRSTINSCNALEIGTAMLSLADTLMDASHQIDFYRSDWGSMTRSIAVLGWELSAYTNLSFPNSK